MKFKPSFILESTIIMCKTLEDFVKSGFWGFVVHNLIKDRLYVYKIQTLTNADNRGYKLIEIPSTFELCRRNRGIGWLLTVM